MKFMRIKGEDKPQNIIRLPRLGKIRLGIKKVAQSGKEYPVEVDYFVVPDELKSKFGEKPKTLPVMIAVEDEEKSLRQYYACYGSSQKIKCQGDGEFAERRDDKGKIFQVTCPSPPDCDFAKQFKCHARIDIMLVLPDVNMGGCYQLSSGSVNTDIDLRSGLEMARYLFGRISWVPMMITREERKIPDPETGKMQTHWPVRLYPTATVSEVNQIRSDTNRIIERQERFALPEPIIEGEFRNGDDDNREGAPEVNPPPPEVKTPPPAPDFAQLDGITEFIRMIGEADSQQEIDTLFRSNSSGINALKAKERARVIDAKHKRESDLIHSANLFGK